jgi:predicted DNA-binding transcriptional regulator YafY
MRRNRQVVRQWRIVRELQASRHGITVSDLARELAVTTGERITWRTVTRDLEALEETGFPLWKDGARWHVLDWRQEAIAK